MQCDPGVGAFILAASIHRQASLISPHVLWFTQIRSQLPSLYIRDSRPRSTGSIRRIFPKIWYDVSSHKGRRNDRSPDDFCLLQLPVLLRAFRIIHLKVSDPGTICLWLCHASQLTAHISAVMQGGAERTRDQIPRSRNSGVTCCRKLTRKSGWGQDDSGTLLSLLRHR